MNRIWVVVILIIVLSSLLFLSFYLEERSYGKIAINEIRNEYNGIVVDIFSTRKGVRPTFIKIENTETGFHKLSVLSDAINHIEIGDSIIKPKNDNVLIVKRNNQEMRFILNLISKKLRRHKNFPDEWRDRWMDADPENYNKKNITI